MVGSVYCNCIIRTWCRRGHQARLATPGCAMNRATYTRAAAADRGCLPLQFELAAQWANFVFLAQPRDGPSRARGSHSGPETIPVLRRPFSCLRGSSPGLRTHPRRKSPSPGVRARHVRGSRKWILGSDPKDLDPGSVRIIDPTLTVCDRSTGIIDPPSQ